MPRPAGAVDLRERGGDPRLPTWAGVGEPTPAYLFWRMRLLAPSDFSLPLTVRGGQGDDRLDGGEGDDDLWGDRGADTLTGGAGLSDCCEAAPSDRVFPFN